MSVHTPAAAMWDPGEAVGGAANCRRLEWRGAGHSARQMRPVPEGRSPKRGLDPLLYRDTVVALHGAEGPFPQDIAGLLPSVLGLQNASCYAYVRLSIHVRTSTQQQCDSPALPVGSPSPKVRSFRGARDPPRCEDEVRPIPPSQVH